MHYRIFHLCEQMSENLEHDWTLEEMAEMLNISKSYLVKLFKAETGMSAVAWLRNERLEKARELLEESWEQVSQIGLNVGMPNDSHFTRDFKKKYGTTPTNYRKQYNEMLQAGADFGKK